MPDFEFKVTRLLGLGSVKDIVVGIESLEIYFAWFVIPVHAVIT